MRTPMTKITKDKISKSKKDSIPWNKGKKGLQVAWNRGLKGIMKANKTSFTSEQLKEKWKNPLFKKQVSEKISLSMKGVPLSEEHKAALRGERPHTRGENSSCWKGGHKNDRGHGKLVEYKIWRLSVFERDEFTCQDCGQRGGKLNAHHILYWSDFPEYRYEVWNGVTLCVSCHRKIHFKTSNKLGTAT